MQAPGMDGVARRLRGTGFGRMKSARQIAGRGLFTKKRARRPPQKSESKSTAANHGRAWPFFIPLSVRGDRDQLHDLRDILPHALKFPARQIDLSVRARHFSVMPDGSDLVHID